jgi:hypothetical protein
MYIETKHLEYSSNTISVILKMAIQSSSNVDLILPPRRAGKKHSGMGMICWTQPQCVCVCVCVTTQCYKFLATLHYLFHYLRSLHISKVVPPYISSSFQQITYCYRCFFKYSRKVLCFAILNPSFLTHTLPPVVIALVECVLEQGPFQWQWLKDVCFT